MGFKYHNIKFLLVDWHFTEVSKPDPCPCPLLVVFDLSFKGLRVEHNGNVISDEVHLPI